MPHPLERLAHKLDIHHSLSGDDRAAVLALPYKLRWLEAQSYTLREGDRPDRCAILVSGYAFRHKLTGDGEPADPVARISQATRSISRTCSSTNPTTTCRCLRAARSPRCREVRSRNSCSIIRHVGRAILIHTLVEASIFREWVVNIGRRDARSRIAHLLCEFAYRLSTHDLTPSGVLRAADHPRAARRRDRAYRGARQSRAQKPLGRGPDRPQPPHRQFPELAGASRRRRFQSALSPRSRTRELAVEGLT